MSAPNGKETCNKDHRFPRTKKFVEKYFSRGSTDDWLQRLPDVPPCRSVTDRQDIKRQMAEWDQLYNPAIYTDICSSSEDIELGRPSLDDAGRQTRNYEEKKSSTEVHQKSLNVSNDDFINIPSSTTSNEPDKISRFEKFDSSRNNRKSRRVRLEEKRKYMNEVLQSTPCQTLTLLICFIIFIVAIFFVMPFLIKYLSPKLRSGKPETYQHLTDYIYPTLSAIRTSLIDPDTPKSAYTKKNKDGEDWKLVFSDEFNAEGRTFYPNMDQFWEAVDLNYAATKDLEWYDPDAVFTGEGVLKLQMDTVEQHGLYYRSGMLQSWNKLCFTEGFIEVSAKLPGSSYSAGLWPGIWTLGNLARPGYMASTEGVWPYSYNECDAGITANQSSNDGLSSLPGQKLSKCTCQGEDHPNIGVGRGAPEIDLLEGAHSTKVIFGVASQTLQVAPFDIWYLPDYDFIEIHNFTKSNINSYLGTPFQEMVSTITTLNDYWYESIANPNDTRTLLEDAVTFFQTYGVEYMSKSVDKYDSYCRFYLGTEPTATIYGSALHPNGNVGWRDVPKEPMSVILNLGLSTAWSQIAWFNILFPVTFEIDYVRIYQPEGMKQMTCDPQDYPTSNYINEHMNAYMNPNLTSWKSAGYKFPKNRLTSKCK